MLGLGFAPYQGPFGNGFAFRHRHASKVPAFGQVFQLTNLVTTNPEGVVVTIDRMKKQEELLVGSFLNLQGSTAPVRFSDSKADDRLQAADIWAGFMRTGWETYFANPRTHTPRHARLAYRSLNLFADINVGMNCIRLYNR